MRTKASIAVLSLMIAVTAGAIQLDRPPQGLTGQGVVVDPALRAVLDQPAWHKAAPNHGFRVRDGHIQVLADSTAPQRTENWLIAEGAHHVLRSRSGRVQAWVEPATVDRLAARSEVSWVGRPDYVQLPEPFTESTTAKVGNELTEGFAAMNAAPWHAAGITGAGVKVGLIDAGFEDYANLLGSDLPPVERVRLKEIGGSQNEDSGNHGTGCAEIVSDIAPDAELYLAVVSTNVDIESAMSWLANNGVQVITMSLGFATLSAGDGTGTLHDAIADSANQDDILWATSAGNSRQGHWQGQTVDADGDGWIEFVDGEEINLFASRVSADSEITPAIVWNDWSVVDQDYSLHLFRIDDNGNPVEVASADRLQNGSSTQRPSEQLRFTTTEAGTYGLGVFRKNVSGLHDLEIFDADRDLEFVVEEGSITIPADSPDLLAVAAATPGTPYSIRSYSSAGPANGPGGYLDGGSLKPDIAGYDGVSTVSLDRFYGTSAASPHVGGAAALVRSAHPEWNMNEVRSFLLERAIDKGAAGPDVNYGYGRLSLGTPPGLDCSYSVTPESALHSSAQGGGLIQVSAADGCFWSASKDMEWVVISPDSGSGDGYVAYTVLANPSAASRQGVLLVADHEIVVSQEGASCSYLLEPDELSFDAAGDSGSVSVSTGEGCTWQAESATAWVTVTAGSGVGSGSLRFSVAANPDAADRTGAIGVGDAFVTITQHGAGSASYRALVGGIAESPGDQGTQWSSNLAVMNPGSAAATLSLSYRHAGAEIELSAALAAGAIVEWQAVATSLFGVSEPSSGVVEVLADQPVVVTARTFNQGASGSFGQFLPGVNSPQALPAGEQGYLSPLASNGRFRTNIGFVNTGAADATATIRIFAADGSEQGNPLLVDIPAGAWIQRNRALNAAGAGGCAACYAVIEITGEAWAYASVVDNDSGDPTTIPAVARRAGGVGRRFMVAGMADAEGANDTRWKSTLAVVNPEAGAAQASLTYIHGSQRDEAQLSFDTAGLVSWDNVVEELFSTPQSSGAVELTTTDALIITARTYNESADGTFGQFLPAVEAAEALAAGEIGLLTQIKSTDAFRTNIGFVSFSNTVCEASISLFDDQGNPSGLPLTLSVPANGWAQKNGVFDAAGVDTLELGYAQVQVVTGGCQLWAYASVVDNATGDPTTVPMIALD